ncbi:MAG: hypothetical protein E7378_03190 [Clostridiales bacterium]|nr:hypothetical protein [Clostridiales bacterium]
MLLKKRIFAPFTSKQEKKACRIAKKKERLFMRNVGYMRKIINGLVFQLSGANKELQTDNFKLIDQLNVVPSDFKKLSDEEVKYGLQLMVKYNFLKSYRPTKLDEEDGYLLIFNHENRSQERFSNNKKPNINRIPETIDLNSVEVEPVITNQSIETKTATSDNEEQAKKQTQTTYVSPW